MRVQSKDFLRNENITLREQIDRLREINTELMAAIKDLFALNEWGHGEACDYSHVYSKMNAALEKAEAK
jgi:hypothetical protein